MSKDLLKNIIPDKDYNEIILTMSVNNSAWLVISPGDESCDPAEYHLSPDDNGIKRAKDIISALNAWIEHVQS